MSSEIISVLVLAAISLLVVANQFSKGHGSYRLLIILITSLFLIPAILYLFLGNGGAQFQNLLQFSYSLENTLAYAFIILLFWGLTMLLDVGNGAILITAGLSALLLWATWAPKWRPLQSEVRSFFVLFAMMFAIIGLIREQENVMWMDISLLSPAFALNPMQLTPFLVVFENHHYLNALSMFCTRKAIASGSVLVFGK